MIEDATWRLPEGHERVAAFASLDEARDDARRLLRMGADGWAFYVSDKRGAFEVIRHPTSTQPLG